jgi:protein SCO1/2
MRNILVATLLSLLAWSCGNAPAPNLGGDFTLTNQDGRRMALHDLKGKSVLLFFGYTHCPDACPTMLSKLTRVYRLLGDNAKRVQTVFVSVDPERDSPAALKEYLSNFSIPVIGMTGTKAEIDKTISAYGGSYEITPSKSAAGPAVAHTTWLYLIDEEGQLRSQFEPGEDAEKIAGFVRQVTD